MTQKDAIAAFLAGEQVLFVEYFTSKADHIRWTDKDTRKPLEADVLSHTVLTAEAAIRVDQRLEEGQSAAQVKAMMQSNIKRGDKVLLRFSMLAVNKGSITCRGTLDKVTA